MSLPDWNGFVPALTSSRGANRNRAHGIVVILEAVRRSKLQKDYFIAADPLAWGLRLAAVLHCCQPVAARRTAWLGGVAGTASPARVCLYHKAALHSELRLVGLSDVGDHHGCMQPANCLRQLMIRRWHGRHFQRAKSRVCAKRSTARLRPSLTGLLKAIGLICGSTPPT